MPLKNRYFSRHVLLFLLFLVAAPYLCAAPVNESTARQVALRFAAAQKRLRSAPQEPSLILTGDTHPHTPLRHGEQVSLYYIYSFGANNGFVIVSGEDTTYPILGYATTGDFLAQEMPENLTSWLAFYNEEILAAIRRNRPADAAITMQWQDLMRLQTRSIEPAVLLPTANWDQNAPYNALCPTDKKGNTSVTGCVATAMGIVMHYYKWPDKGTGENHYLTRTESTEVTATFNTRYDWGNMLNNYTRTHGVANWNAAQGQAVARLLFHCGASIEMNYTSSTSGAYTNDVVSALVDNFKYDKSLSLLSRDLYSYTEWSATIRAELDQNRPVMYGGATQALTGHFFVIDGYASTDEFFHVNWGWSGYSNGYFRLSGLSPKEQGTGGNKEGAGYDYYQDAIIGMRKAETHSFTNNELHFYIPKNDDNNGVYGLYLKEDPIVQNEPFMFYFTYITDYGKRDFHGQLGVFHEDTNGAVKDTLDIFATDADGLPAGWSFYDEEGTELVVKEPIEEGDQIRMYYRPEGYDWRPLRGGSGIATSLSLHRESPTKNKSITATEEIRVEKQNAQLHTWFAPETEIQQIKVYDLQGRMIATQSYDRAVSPLVMDLQGNDPSVYIVTVHTPKGVSSHKISARE